ncbi:uncharacterized protein si:dkeyp-51f12.3 [Limanda limanda]|uniref:uncharacterized protein si:dkeyp-51f12.3 n=1 Tax=Limanda limanda TaxID=27771 RepID=UPI0029C9131F|nr:uncharacterized protein si:dkeyp-51f12.3 [Limanda limanda]
MPQPRRTLLFVGVFLLLVGGVSVLGVALPFQSVPFFVVGAFLGMAGLSLLVSVLFMAMQNIQVAVPGHFLLHPRTGTRFSPPQALAIQRRLDRIRREMSADSVGQRPEPEPPLPSTPPPWTMEPPPSYDTVMKSQEQSEQL